MTTVHQDAARIVAAVAETKLAERGETATVGVAIPDNWKLGDGPHVQIDTDGGPAGPVAAWHTIRITAWATGRTEAVRLANLTRALLMTHRGGQGMHRPRGGTAVTTARESRTSAYLAGCTITVPVRVAHLDAPSP